MKRLLIVDDDPEIRRSMARLLRDEYIVEQASDGLHAAGLAESKVYDLILLDVRMPVFDGIDFLRWLATRPQKVPVIVVTASSDSRLQEMNLPDVEVVYKPFDVSALEARIRSLVQIAR